MKNGQNGGGGGMTRSQLGFRFAEVKRRYFPRWDRAGEWQAVFAAATARRGNTGYCDSKAKTIFLDDTLCETADAFATAFLVHEICHDVAAAHHNRKWAKAMEAAARIAEKCGDDAVARYLRNEVFCEAGNGVLKAYTSATVVELVESLPLDRPLPTVDEAIEDFAKHLGVSRSKFHRDFAAVVRSLWTDVRLS